MSRWEELNPTVADAKKEPKDIRMKKLEVCPAVAAYKELCFGRLFSASCCAIPPARARSRASPKGGQGALPSKPFANSSSQATS